ncbi:hypothetical protein IQ238_28035 [Pleurocapsales cyanobacterium LEGE 06147]|nr:hypothetical protein [Pleurocapsales cyanobacterium LEGE 06147]
MKTPVEAGIFGWQFPAPNFTGSFDIWLAKYDGEGNQLESEQFGNESIDLCHSINGDGNVYFSGHSDNSAPDGERALLDKH